VAGVAAADRDMAFAARCEARDRIGRDATARSCNNSLGDDDLVGLVPFVTGCTESGERMETNASLVNLVSK
jgi:hypothetical protein